MENITLNSADIKQNGERTPKEDTSMKCLYSNNDDTCCPLLSYSLLKVPKKLIPVKTYIIPLVYRKLSKE